MKKMILVFMVIYLSLSIEELYSQNGVNEEDSISITQDLKAIYGVDYEISDIVDVDSVKNIYNSEFGMINDPYGTLHDCLLFTSNRKEMGVNGNYSSIVGIFKNNQIIWRSDFILPESYTYGNIFGSIDLNNDGKVDIITKWNDNEDKDKDLLIYEWDGTSGEIINVDSEYGPNIGTSEYTSFKFADFKGDGIWEIVGFEPTSTDPTFNLPNNYQIYVYSWDGIKYSYSRIIEMNSLEIFFPRTKFTAQIKTTVKKDNSHLLKYNYKVYNNSSSTQYINRFDIYCKMDSITNKINPNISSPVGWQNSLYYTVVSWDDNIDDFMSILTFKYKIKPGTELDNFSFEAQGLPSIVEVYLRGLNYDLAQGDDNYNKVDDYIHNSVIDTTVGPSNPPSPFIPEEFLDTLINYNNQSYNLGWVKDEQTRDKYDNYFNNAKNYLNQNNNNAAKSELQKVLTDCNADSSNVLTSEAYALLYFNTDYLIKQIPEGEQGLPEKLKNSQGNLLPVPSGEGGSLQYVPS